MSKIFYAIWHHQAWQSNLLRRYYAWGVFVSLSSHIRPAFGKFVRSVYNMIGGLYDYVIMRLYYKSVDIMLKRRYQCVICQLDTHLLSCFITNINCIRTLIVCKNALQRHLNTVCVCWVSIHLTHLLPVLFRGLNVDDQSGIQHEKLYSMYQALYRGVLSENQIMGQVMQILESPMLSIPGVITEADFNMVSW